MQVARIHPLSKAWRFFGYLPRRRASVLLAVPEKQLEIDSDRTNGRPCGRSGLETSTSIITSSAQVDLTS
jgi:hypothetical protein